MFNLELEAGNMLLALNEIEVKGERNHELLLLAMQIARKIRDSGEEKNRDDHQG
ncbi:MAG: hypothetical protein PUH70_12345 [Clostridiales bacterium]|nr:hypothetical protein [Clostridiales bacterium]MDY5514861.1 hypothetical protein [Candidatus Ventricola sp.]